DTEHRSDMAFKTLFDVPVDALTPKKKPKSDQVIDLYGGHDRGCRFCPSNNKEGINKIKGTIRGKKILVVAQSPGPEENEEGVELFGKSGEWWWAELARVGVERDDCDIQNVMRC